MYIKIKIFVKILVNAVILSCSDIVSILFEVRQDLWPKVVDDSCVPENYRLRKENRDTFRPTRNMEYEQNIKMYIIMY